MASSTPPINKRFFQTALAERGMSQRQLAHSLGVDPSGISLVFSGKRRMRIDEAADISRLLGLPMSEVLANAGVTTPKANAVRLRGWIDPHGEVHCYGEQGGLVDCPIEMPEGSMAYQARTAMSGLEYMDGWIYFCLPPNAADPVSNDALNRMCIMRTTEMMGLFGYLKRGYEKGKYSVYISDRVTNDVTLEWACPIKFVVTGT